jgi:hypothetical protein
VAALMADGMARTDEEIHGAFAGRWSPDVTRHARRALEQAGRVVETGERRQTTSGARARVWRAVS